MRTNAKNKNPIQIDGNIIENVENFTYVGSNVSIDGAAAKDANLRIRKARGVFARMSNIWRANYLGIKTKLKIFNAYVKSVLLYGCEIWNVIRNTERKLQSFINRCLRSILRLWWPKILSNEDLWKLTESGDINLEIKQRKFGWIGHTLRKGRSEICASALTYKPQGKRKRGRPKQTWLRTTLKDNGKSFHEMEPLANNRDLWKSFVNDLCS
jgi:hypothetical protein